MRNKTLYPKTKATILQVTYYGKRVGQTTVKSFTPEEWEQAHFLPGKRRYYFVKTVTRLQLDETGEVWELDNKQLAYTGSRMKYQWQVKEALAPGRRVKLFKKPLTAQRWLYKLEGE